MKRFVFHIISFIILFTAFIFPGINGQDVFRFVHLGTEQGLSQNTGSSILFDSKGFMWIGTMNGLNRYDGYEFKIFKGQSDNAGKFTNNRVTRLWEDKKGFIWAETHDGYYHYFNPKSEIFSAIPDYKENLTKYFRINSFLQYTEDIIILGSTNAGIFILQYDQSKDTYKVSQFPDKGNQPLSNNNIRFVYSDRKGDLWIGTAKGINYVGGTDLKLQKFSFQHQYVNASFTSVCEDDQNVWFGTEELGIILYNKEDGAFLSINRSNTPSLPSDGITMLYFSRSGHHITGFDNGSVIISGNSMEKWTEIPFHGKALNGVYEDCHGQLWLTAVEFGVTRVDMQTRKSEYYLLTPEEMKHLTDLERPQFFEDRYDNLWIGLHGGGLALYHRQDNRFRFFRNDPRDPNSISSNIIHSVAEDNTGQMWLGTGQFLGGIEKVILENRAFRHILVEEERVDMLDNVVRAIMEDRNHYLWVATKAGRLHIYNDKLKKIATLDSLAGIGRESIRNNTYSLFNDRKGYIWIGSKGDGLSVSTQPIHGQTDYRKIKYRRFKQSSDTTSLGSNNIYSICQDSSYNIWVGTYGNGLNLMREPYSKNSRFIRINQQNSKLSSNLVRNLLVDKRGNLWVATTLGLNFMSKENIDKGHYEFRTFFKDPANENSVGYNDIVQLFEDSKGRIWLGTFGCGADMLEVADDQTYKFTHFTSENGLSNDVIFGILEDEKGNIWFSTENGLTCYNSEIGNASIYNTYNGLNFNNFSENTCFERSDHSLCFGGYLGLELVYPGNLLPEKTEPRIELTSFLLFNKEVPVNQSGSPLNRNISFTKEIRLKYNQSSFSINFSALDFLDPGKISYTYRLENFEEEWNNVGNQHKATYTNLSPGRYIFRVKSLKSNEPSDSTERILHIRIMPPWWRTIPAYLSYMILLGVIGVVIYKTVSRLNRYRNELLVEKKVNELKLQFFTNISHEIRTPLTLIISPIEDILGTHGISPRNRTLMEIIHKNAKRMLHLTTQLLDFRKIQNNRMILKIEQVDLIPFAREIYESFIPLAKHKGILYNFESHMDSLTVYADASKLDTMIYNIISNAIKFTAQGKRVVVVIDKNTEGFVDISVTDEGPGIPQKNLSDIFTRYTILSNHDFAGTGIGLSLSYELAKLHQGDILISSTEGKGSTFTIRLPADKRNYGETAVFLPEEKKLQGTFTHHTEEPVETGTEEKSGMIPLPSAGRQNILIVEDNQEILNYISQALHSSFICIGAKNGEEGLHIARSMNPDLIITDIMMPGMSGLDMTRMIKEDFNTCHIPVVMLTSRVDMSDQITGIESGAEAYILKPFNMEYLRAVAVNLLHQRTKILARYTGNRDIPVDAVKVATRDEEFMKKVITFVEENYENDFSIETLAESCCVGRTVFYNKVKGLTGLGPLELVRKIKLKIAAQLLDKGYNVSEAAYKTGFSDVKYFSRQFKSQFGIPPSRHEKVGSKE